MRWGRHEGRLRELAGAWREGRSREALLALAQHFPDGSPQAATRELIERLSLPASQNAADNEPLEPTASRRELRDLAAFQKADDLDHAACLERVQGMVDRAERHPALGWLATESRVLLASLDDDSPLQVAILGSFSTGKSSLVNAILGSEVLPTGLVPVTASLTVISWGERAGATIVFQDGERRSLELEQLGEFTDQRSEDGADLREVDRVEVQVPVELLKRITLYDTPGFNSGYALHELVTERVISRADAVLWVFDVSQLGSEVERQEIEHIRRSTGKAVALVNKIDTIRRPRYKRKPEAWLAKIGEILDEVRDGSPFGKLIDHWVPVSAKWIVQEHEQGGMERIVDVLAQFEERKEQIKAEARLRHLREAARRAIALEQLQDNEESEGLAEREAWLGDGHRWAAELRSDWRDEIRLARRQRVPDPPQSPADSRGSRGVAGRLLPELSRGFAGEPASAEDAWRGAALEAWSALDGLSAVLAAGKRFGPVWETALLRARDLEAREPQPARRWREPCKVASQQRADSLTELLLAGDTVLESSVDSWIDGGPPRPVSDAPSPSGHWQPPGLEPATDLEALLERLPCSRLLVSRIAQERELRLVRSASRQIFVKPAERWAVPLGFLRSRGPLEVPPDPKLIEQARQFEERCFHALPKRQQKHDEVGRCRESWRGSSGAVQGRPRLPDSSDENLPRRVRKLFTAARPGLEASVGGSLPDHVGELKRRSWRVLGRVALWSALLCFLGSFAHVEVKEWLDFDVTKPEDRASLAVAALERVGVSVTQLPDLPDLPDLQDLPEVGGFGAWVDESWSRLVEAFEGAISAPPEAPVPLDEPEPEALEEPVSPRAKLEAACDRGDPSSCAELGRLLLTGSAGAGADDSTAEALLAKACRLGEDDGPCIQAGVLARAQGDSPGREEAIDLFSLACDRGAIDGCVQAAESHLEPGGDEASTSRACAMLVTACEASHRGACKRLAALMSEGQGRHCPDAALEALRIACVGEQDEVCWTVAQGLGCLNDASGADCWVVMQQACASGVVEACG